MSEFTLLSAADQAANHLRERILSGAWNDELPGAPMLAAELGINHRTIIAALSQLEQQGLLIGQGAGRRRKIVLPDDHKPPGLRVALLLFDAKAQGDDYYIDLLHRLEAAGHLPFYTDMCLDDLGQDIGRVARYVAKTEADAWIVAAAPRDTLEWFARQETPAFALFGARAGVPIAATGPDKGPTFAEVTRRLVELGHHRISFIVRHALRRPEPVPSIRAYLDELEAAGITTGQFNLPDWDESLEGFKHLLDSLFDGPTPPTALMLDEAFLFNASYHHLSQRGLKIPQDVSLICTDSDPGFVWCDPPVSHIRWDYRPVVRHIVRWVNNLAAGKDDSRQTLTKAEFVEGGTVGPVIAPS